MGALSIISRKEESRAQDVASAWLLDHWGGVEKVELTQKGRVLESHDRKKSWLQIHHPMELYHHEPSKRIPFILLVDDSPTPLAWPWNEKTDASFRYYQREHADLLMSGVIDSVNPYKFLKVFAFVIGGMFALFMLVSVITFLPLGIEQAGDIVGFGGDDATPVATPVPTPPPIATPELAGG